MKKNLHRDVFLIVLLLQSGLPEPPFLAGAGAGAVFKWQNMAETGAEIMDKGGAGVGAENK